MIDRKYKKENPSYDGVQISYIMLPLVGFLVQKLGKNSDCLKITYSRSDKL